jgi:hypothetical protein
MTVSFSLFRRAVREPSYRTVPGATPTSTPITPIGTFRKAICCYHTDGRQPAIDGIALTSDYWRKDPRGKSVARNYRNSLDTYFRLDAADGRPTYDVGVREQVMVSGQPLGVYIDALVYRATAHTARIALWDVPLPSAEQAAVVAAPVMEALEHAVGSDRAHSVAFWHLRTGAVIEVDLAIADVQRAACKGTAPCCIAV